jgi:hypothetical protein
LRFRFRFRFLFPWQRAPAGLFTGVLRACGGEREVCKAGCGWEGRIGYGAGRLPDLESHLSGALCAIGCAANSSPPAYQLLRAPRFFKTVTAIYQSLSDFSLCFSWSSRERTLLPFFQFHVVELFFIQYSLFLIACVRP